MMEAVVQNLQEHRQLCRELLAAFETEAGGLQNGDVEALARADAVRRQLLPRLEEVTRHLREQRQAWEKKPEERRLMSPELRALLEETQGLVLRLLTLDRENQQARLRLGLVPPQHWPTPPPVSGQGYVSELYRRHQVA